MSTINNYNSTDYSTLFSSLTGSSSSTSGSTSNNILSDYASIKNGSYGKVLKAYYAKQDSSSESSSMENDTAKNLNTIQAATSTLTKSTDALLANGAKSLFTKTEDSTTSSEYDRTAIYNGLKSFVENYNSLINSAGDSSNSSILRQTVSLVKNTIANEKMLSSVGITINKDNTLSIDESNCKKANINDLTSLFSGSGSFASQVSAKASSIAFYAKNAANGVSTYTSAGSITPSSTSSGNLLDDYL